MYSYVDALCYDSGLEDGILSEELGQKGVGERKICGKRCVFFLSKLKCLWFL